MKKQVFTVEKDGFCGAWYANPTPSKRGVILMLGDSAEDRMAMCGAKWLHENGYHVMAMSPDKKEHGTHFAFPESMLKKMLPVGSSLLVRMMFRAGKEYPKECRKTREDIDKRLQKAMREW